MALAAFPGAQGFGSTTPGGRGGIVIHVTNLNDSGPGSFRAALQSNLARIIVFDVSGIITNLTTLKIDNPFVTIAGQTAPGEGITIRGCEMQIRSHDVIMRYLRVRTGDKTAPPDGNWANRDALNTGDGSVHGGAYNIVLDHCSFSWSVDEVLTLWFGSHDITIQYCIISEPLWHSLHPEGPHSMCHLYGSDDVNFPTYNISAHHNFLISGDQRNPQFAYCDMIDFRCNLIYNWGTEPAALEKAGLKRINFINNYYLKGPNWDPTNPSCMRVKNDVTQPQLYVSGNIDPLVSDPYADNWTIVRDFAGNAIPENVGGWQFRLFTPLSVPYVKTQPAATCFTCLPKIAGAVRPYRDEVDTRVVQSFYDNAGVIIDSTDQVGGWPPMQSGTKPPDADNDGMPDAWELAVGLNPNNASDANGDRDGDGYTNIEEFINGLASWN